LGRGILVCFCDFSKTVRFKVADLTVICNTFKILEKA
jgi:hypothetical protein